MPLSRLLRLLTHSALSRLAGRGPARPRHDHRLSPHRSAASRIRWVVAAADWLGFEAEPREVRYSNVEALVAASAPALFQFDDEGVPRFLAVLKSGGCVVHLVAPDAGVRAIRPEVIHRALRCAVEGPHAAEVRGFVSELGIKGRRRRAKAEAGLLGQRLARARLRDYWVLRRAPGEPAWQHARAARLPRRLLVAAAAYAAQYALWLLSWWLLGRATFGGRLERGWLFAWILLLVTVVPLRLLYAWSAALFSVGAGGSSSNGCCMALCAWTRRRCATRGWGGCSAASSRARASRAWRFSAGSSRSSPSSSWRSARSCWGCEGSPPVWLPSSVLAGKRLLVVAPGAALRTALTRQAGALGVGVRHAPGLERARRLFVDEGPFDVGLLDEGALPGRGKTAEGVEGAAAWDTFPWVLLTPAGAGRSAAEGLVVAGRINKPVSLARLHDELLAALTGEPSGTSRRGRDRSGAFRAASPYGFCWPTTTP